MKHQVSTGVGVGPGPLFDRGVQTFDAGRDGAGADDEVGIAARGHRGPQALDHLRGRNDGLAVEVPAPLGVDLVFEVAARQAGILEQRVTVRATFIGSPNPVSASISVGRSVSAAICAPRAAGEFWSAW